MSLKIVTEVFSWDAKLGVNKQYDFHEGSVATLKSGGVLPTVL